MSKRWRRGMIGVLLAALLLGVVWKSAPRDRMLLRVATPVVSTASWALMDPSMPGFLPYYWLSNDEVLFFGIGPTGGHQLFRQKVTPGGHPGFPVALPMKEVAASWRPSRLSRQHAWLLWTNWRAPAKFALMATALDGSGTVAWKELVSSRSLTWMPDGRHLVYTTVSNGWQAQILSLDSPQVESVPLTGFNTNDRLSLQGFSPDGKAIGAVNPGFYMAPNLKLDFARFDIGGKATMPIRFAVKAPPGTFVGGATPSPQGDRLLWSCETVLISPVDELLQRFFPAYKAQRKPGHSWWVSCMDGSAMHEVGRTVNRNDDGGIGLQWMPDGKQLSFVYKGQLYIAPAD